MRLLGAMLLLCGLAFADLAKIKAEPKPEKRADLALDHAAAVLKSARDHYNQGEMEKSERALAEMAAAVRLADDSLRSTGKNPRRSPKYFKRAELEIRDLLRRLDSFEQELSFSDRALTGKVKPEIQKIHDDLLAGIMGTDK